MNKLQALVIITSDDVNDPDNVPMNTDHPHTRYWGAWDDSPLPGTRSWVLYNREPETEEEARQALITACFGETA